MQTCIDFQLPTMIWAVTGRDRNWRRHHTVCVWAATAEGACDAVWRIGFLMPKWISKKTLAAEPCDPNTHSYYASIRRSRFAQPVFDN